MEGKGLTEQVKEALRALRLATVRQVAAHLDIPEADYLERRKVYHALRDLVKFHQAEKDTLHGELFYRLAESLEARGGKQIKMWRAMQAEIHGFTVADLTRLSGACRDYAKRYVRWLLGEDFLEVVGYQTREIKVYRIVPGKEAGSAPRWQRLYEEARTRPKGAAPKQEATILDAAVKIRVTEVLGEMEATLARAAGQVQAARDIVAGMKRDLLQVTGGDDGQPGADQS